MKGMSSYNDFLVHMFYLPKIMNEPKMATLSKRPNNTFNFAVAVVWLLVVVLFMVM